jgi:hypothetical protein
MELITSYQVSHAISVAVELELVDRIGQGSKSAGELAQILDAHEGALYRLLRALASMGLLEEDDGKRFTVTPLGALLRSDAPGSLRPMALLHGAAWFTEAWDALSYSVKTGQPAFDRVHGQAFFEFLSEDPRAAAIFDTAMSATASRRFETLRAFDFSRCNTVMDVGGGRGDLLAGLLGTHAHLRGILFDRPEVAQEAEAVLRSAGVADRCDIVSGDFFETVPGGADVYVLAQIIHDWDDDMSVTILKNCRRAMQPGNHVLVIENPIAPGNAPDRNKIRDLTMLVLLPGRERTVSEFQTLLRAADFEFVGATAGAPPWSLIDAVAI